MVSMTVSQKDIGRVQLIGCDRRLRIASKERIEQKPIRTSLQISGRMTKKSEFHKALSKLQSIIKV